MPLDELIDSFDITRLTKTNSLFDRGKLLAFNTEHMRMASPEKLLKYFEDFLKAINSPMRNATNEILSKLLQLSAGARTLADVEHKCRFLFVPDDAIVFDDKAVNKVLKAPNFMLGVTPQDGLAMLKIVRDKLMALEQFTAANIENVLRTLAEEKKLGLGKIAQPLRVAITGSTVSPPIFDSVELLGKQKTLNRIERTLEKFASVT
jgi:glutamyl-tRNA synthetase